MFNLIKVGHSKFCEFIVVRTQHYYIQIVGQNKLDHSSLNRVQPLIWPKIYLKSDQHFNDLLWKMTSYVPFIVINKVKLYSFHQIRAQNERYSSYYLFDRFDSWHVSWCYCYKTMTRQLCKAKQNMFCIEKWLTLLILMTTYDLLVKCELERLDLKWTFCVNIEGILIAI